MWELAVTDQTDSTLVVRRTENEVYVAFQRLPYCSISLWFWK